MTDAIIFGQDSVTMCGIRYQAGYSVTPSGKVIVFAELDGDKLRLVIERDDEHYADALRAAKSEDLNAEIRADLARIDAEAEAERKARAEDRAAHKAERMAARMTQTSVTSSAATNAAAQVAKLWVDTSIKGKGWEIYFDGGYDRTRVTFAHKPHASVIAAVKSAGFFWSPQLKSWNKKLTCKAFRAAQELAAELKTLYG